MDLLIQSIPVSVPNRKLPESLCTMLDKEVQNLLIPSVDPLPRNARHVNPPPLISEQPLLRHRLDLRRRNVEVLIMEPEDLYGSLVRLFKEHPALVPSQPALQSEGFHQEMHVLDLLETDLRSLRGDRKPRTMDLLSDMIAAVIHKSECELVRKNPVGGDIVQDDCPFKPDHRPGRRPENRIPFVTRQDLRGEKLVGIKRDQEARTWDAPRCTDEKLLPFGLIEVFRGILEKHDLGKSGGYLPRSIVGPLIRDNNMVCPETGTLEKTFKNPRFIFYRGETYYFRCGHIKLPGYFFYIRILLSSSYSKA